MSPIGENQPNQRQSMESKKAGGKGRRSPNMYATSEEVDDLREKVKNMTT